MSLGKVVVAKTAGFCFGVNRAVDIVNIQAKKKEKVFTLGDIVHNKNVVLELESRNVFSIKSLDELPDGATLIIRAHGVPKSVVKELNDKNIKYVDATCPFVKKIHKIVGEESAKGRDILIAGDEKHPEVIGIRGYSSKENFVFDSLSSLKKIVESNCLKKDVSVVSQTTFKQSEWICCKDYIKNNFANWSVFDTICSATQLRQEEAEVLSRNMDLMLVVGDKQSSNTNKLYDICMKNCETIFAESVLDVDVNKLKNYDSIGITAGASTPGDLIKKIENLLVADNIKLSSL